MLSALAEINEDATHPPIRDYFSGEVHCVAEQALSLLPCAMTQPNQRAGKAVRQGETTLHLEVQTMHAVQQLHCAIPC